MKVLVVNVRLSELHTQQLEVGAWEVPVIEAVHGSADVEVVGELVDDRTIPEAVDEFQRLLNRYKGDPEQGGEPYVVQVYGQHRAGVESLARAIEASQPAEARTVSLSRLRVDELHGIAEEFGLDHVEMTRDQLIEAIRAAQAEAEAA